VSIPGLSQRAVYYTVKYRNAGNQVVAQTGLQALMTPEHQIRSGSSTGRRGIEASL
jgi:hypothetical protein